MEIIETNRFSQREIIEELFRHPVGVILVCSLYAIRT